jgi:hypothetical protein
MADELPDLDPTLLTPLTREVFGARDEILAILDRLSDDRKAGMALTYAAATWATRLADARGAQAVKVAQHVAVEIVKITLDEVVTRCVVSKQKGG